MIIQMVKDAGLIGLNGDLLIAKQPAPKKTKGGIIVSDTFAKRESYFQGFGRIIQIPSTGFASTAGIIAVPTELQEGDFILFNHASRMTPNAKLMNMLLNVELQPEQITDNHFDDETYDSGILFYVPFPDIKCIKPAAKVIAEAK